MIYLVDNTIDGKGDSPREIQEALAKIAPQVEVVRERYFQASPQRLEELKPSHIILSGQSHPWDIYAPPDLAGVKAIITGSELPTLAVCGGHQLVALTYGARVDVMKRIAPGEGYAGCVKERGFYEVETDRQNIFSNLPERINVWHSHYDEVKDLPDEFTLTASNASCRIQAMQHKTRPLYAVQFHPELFDDAHPHGQTVLENFLAL